MMIHRRRRENSGRMFASNEGEKSPATLAPLETPPLAKKLKLCTILLCAVSLHLIALNAARPVSASYKNQHHYDPEQQDGIPVFSARSIAKMDDEWNGDMQESMKPRVMQRRQADNDLDDGLEEEDEDEYKSGSSPHESIESPSYGESQRFARDGDEIEDFFDKHLGPPKEHDSADESAEQPTIIQQEVMAPAVDPDDHFEAAASGPISSIFQSLLGHDRKPSSKRPFLQISTSSSEADSDSSSTTTTASEEPKAASTVKGLKASQSAQSFVEAPPISLAIAPVAAQSSLSVQEPSVHEQELSGGVDPYAPADPTGAGGVREIYIGRRPTVMSYLQQQQQQHKPQLQHLSGYTTAGSANVWRGPNGQPVVYEQEQANDYSRNPVAASYVYQQQPSNAAQSTEVANGAGDDEQTVTYGLSFGGSGSAADEPASETEAADPASSGIVESPPSQQPQAYAPYNTRYTTSSTRALNNYYNNYYRQPPPAAAAGYMRAYPVHPQQLVRQPQMQQQQMVPMYRHAVQYQQQPQQYAGNGPTRYHRDPSESSTHLAAMRAALAHRGANYDQSSYDGPVQRGLGGDTNRPDDRDQMRERQRLLASLDREIKASSQYQSNQAATSDASALRNSYLRRPYNGRQLVTYKEVKKTLPGDELDTYTSYHSETDPYKTQTTTSRMVNDPLRFLVPSRHPMTGEYGFGPNHDHAGTSNHVANQSPETNLSSHQASQTGSPRDSSAPAENTPNQQQQHQTNSNLLTGPLTNYDTSHPINGQGDLLRNGNNGPITSSNDGSNNSGEMTRDHRGHSRVRRDDSDEREIDNDTDDDGVWVDDDDDDDNRQQSSDVNETSQYPEEEGDDDGQQDDASNNVLTPQQINPPGVIGGPHGYELSPNDLMIYHG